MSYTNPEDSTDIYTNPEDSTDIKVEYGLIQFDSYLTYKLRAVQARDYLLSLDVTPESEQEYKRTVAAARKISEQLNDAKIRAKKRVLEPYMAFEDQVKEIIGIITEGENVARDKLKAIDEKRKDEKREQLREIWNARAGSFEAGKYLEFEDFLLDRFLNKTVPISEVEKEMVKFLMDSSRDIQYLSQKPLSEEYIAEYKNCLDAIRAMEIVDARHTVQKAMSQEPYMVIRITGKADVILAKQMLKDINYKVLEEK